LFCEIPLLVESKLTKYFDKVIFVKSSKSLRLKRYILMGGNEKLFNFLDKKQIKVSRKAKFCDHVIVNNKSLTILKKNLLNIIKKYV
jgi:dephospho-CoA kinase